MAKPSSLITSIVLVTPRAGLAARRHKRDLRAVD